MAWSSQNTDGLAATYRVNACGDVSSAYTVNKPPIE